MLTSCSFTVNIWKKVCLTLKIPRFWEGDNLDQSVYRWYKKCKVCHTLPAIISSKIWNVRNISLFEDHLHDPNSIYLQILNLEKEFSKRTDLTKKPRVMKDIQHFGVFGYFDGEEKLWSLCCGRNINMFSNKHS